MDIDTAKLAIGEILCELERDKSEQTLAENYAIAEGFLEEFLKEKEPRQHCADCDCILNVYDPHPTLCVSCEKLKRAGWP